MSISSTNRSLQLLLRMTDPRTATQPMIDPLPPKPEIPRTTKAVPLPRHTPEQHGIPSSTCTAFLQALRDDPTLRMHSVMILRDGCVVCEAAFGAQHTDIPRMTFSACKSITAMAVGILMDDGLLQPADRVTDFFPDAGNLVSKQLLKNTTVEDLLSMQTGNQFNELACMTDDDWLRGFSTSPSLREKFQYNSLNTYILSRIVCAVSGKSMTEFLRERLFEPMQIYDYYWEVCPKGFEKGGWGLYMRAEDLGKLGQLIHDHGNWNGAQLLSREFLNDALTAHAQAPKEYGAYNYGWQFWVGRSNNSVLFNGMLGQNVLCFRNNGITLVSHAANEETFQQSNYFALAEQFFGGGFTRKLPRNTRDLRVLHRTIDRLRDPRSCPPSRRDLALFAPKRFVTEAPRAVSAGLLPLSLQVIQNYYTKGVRAVSVGGSRSAVELVYEEKDCTYRVLAGTKSPLIQTLDFGGNKFRVAARATFTHDEDAHRVVRIQLDFLETPFTRILKLILVPGGMLLKQEETPHMDLILDKALSTSMPGVASAIGSIFGTGDLEFLRWKMSLVFSPVLEFYEENKK